jgi:hypothetical protein
MRPLAQLPTRRNDPRLCAPDSAISDFYAIAAAYFMLGVEADAAERKK